MSVALDIMLERLKTHPEEFLSLVEDVKIDGKWSPLLQSTSLWATPEDIKQLEEAMAQARKLLADQVALQILSGEYYELPQIKLAYQHPYNKPIPDTLAEDYKEEMKRMMAEQRLARATSK